MPASLQEKGEDMILDFKTIDVYPENHLRVLFDKFAQPSTDIVAEYVKETGDESLHPASAAALIRNLRKTKPHGNDQGKGEKNNRTGIRLKTMYTLSKIATWAQHKRNWRLMGGRVTIMDPRAIKETFSTRFLDHIDYVMDHSELDETHKMKYSNIIKGNTAPTFDEMLEITEYIRVFDRGTVEIEKDPGVRWDIDDWSMHPNLTPKDSWEELED